MLSLCWKSVMKGYMSRSQSMFDSVCRFAYCWCSLSHKLPSWVLECATMFQSKRMIQHNWCGTRSSRTSEEGWCFLIECVSGLKTQKMVSTLRVQQYLKDVSEVENNMYRTRWIKSKIIERHVKEHVIFSEICVRRDVVCFCKMVNHIINDKWYTDKQSGIEEESVHIVKRAARLIKDSICEVQYHISNSPTLAQIHDKDLIQQWVPHIVRTSMANLTANKLKQTSVGHSIV